MAESAPLNSGTGKNSVPSATPVPANKTQQFAAIAIERGYCTALQISKAREEHERQSSAEDFGAFLVKGGILTQEQARACDRSARGADVIGGFKILEKVGQGGMGAVYRALQISMDRVVALKILPPKLAQDPGFKKRFLHEARLSAKLTHLNIINGIDCGEESGYTFFAMEFVEGKTVKELLKERGKLAPDDAFKIIHQMAEALIYARRQGLVHRDIKPDNIMLTGAGVAKLCDLGLAKQTENADDASLTQAGQAVGTPHFISPEQARGEKSVDFRSDIYSLGGTFYNMLTDKTPFEAPTGAAVMALHITDEAKSPCDLDPTIPDGFGQIIAKMMAKSAADRYATPEELLEDLDAVKHGNAPRAARFFAKSSCQMPHAGSHRPRGQTTGPYAPPEKRIGGTSKQQAAQKSIPAAVMVAACAAVLAGAAGIYFLTKSSNTDQASHPLPPTPPFVNPPPAAVLPVPPKVPLDEHKTPAVVAPVPKPPPLEIVPAKAPEVAVKKPEPAVPVKPPAILTAEADTSKNVQISAVVLVPAEPPPPKLEINSDILYARVLHERTAKGADLDLQKLQNRVRDLSLNAEYNVAHDDLNAELTDLTAAAFFEHEILKAMAKTGGMLQLNEETARKFGAAKGKIQSFDGTRGLFVDVNGAGLWIKAHELPFDEMFKASPDQSALAKVGYLAAMGKYQDALPLLGGLRGDEKTRWERKLRLMIKGETELSAQAAYDRLIVVADAKHWQTFNKLVAEFYNTFGATNVAEENIVSLTEWKAAAKSALAPVEGMEISGFAAEKFPKINPCTVKVSADDKGNGNKVLVVEADAGEAERSAISCKDKKIDLTGKTMLVLRARHNHAKALPVTLVFFDKEAGLLETIPAQLPPEGWNEVTFKIEGAVFKGDKGESTGKYDQEMSARENIKKFGFVIYSSEPYKLELDSIFLQ